MRILLDTHDLIRLVERQKPVTLEAAANFLNEGGHELVFSFTNIRELAAPLAKTANFLDIRDHLQTLEALPHTYIREVPLIQEELGEAVSAFTQDREFVLPNLFVDRWDKTLAPLSNKQVPLSEMLVGLRLDDIVHMIYKQNPALFAAPVEHLPMLMRVVEGDRALLAAKQAPANEHFANAIRKHAARAAVELPAGKSEDFIRWIYESPARCPGIRLNHEVYRALLANTTDIPEAADFSDLAHVSVVPYVDCISLDKRIRNYCSIASRRMNGDSNELADRIHNNFSFIIDKFAPHARNLQTSS